MNEFFRKLAEAIEWAASDMADGESANTEIEVEWDQSPDQGLNLTVQYWAVVNKGDPIYEHSRLETLNW